MTDSFVTQCPHCRTSFRVSASQLSAAHGAVRCGACLHVFNATAHLLEKPKTQPVSPATPTVVAAPAAGLATPPSSTPAARKDPLDTVWIHDDLDLDSLDLDEELARLEREEQQRFIPIEGLAAQAKQANQTSGDTRAADERWAERLIEDAQPAEPQAADTPVTEVPATEQRSAASSNDDAASTDEPNGAETETQEDIEAIELTDSRPAVSAQHHATLLELDQDPLQLDWRPPSKPWGRWLVWGALNLLAAAALATQWSLYNFEALARQDRYRPWFEAICPHFGCTLPSKVDINLIKSSNLVVRSHPEFAGALVVDAILYNRASFPQPFPLLELRFSDMDNRLLANRRFKPSEYIAGELSGLSEMPPQTPIRISLDILDPGPEAVNYSLSFQSPE